MTKKIFKSILISSMAVLLAACVIIFCVLYGFFSSAEEKMLEYQMGLAMQGVDTAGEKYFDNLKTNDFRITLIDTDGAVLNDSRANAAAMDNHKDRKEVKEAMQLGVGRDTRYSATLTEKTVYLAKRMTDGKILRVSVTQYSFVPMLVGMLQPVMTLVAAVIVIALLLAKKMAKQIVKPINTIDLKNPLESKAYDELSPLLTRIDKQGKEIEFQKAKLEEKREEFERIYNDLNEGIVAFDENNVILNINFAAKKIFNADDSCIGKDFLTIERNEKVTNMIEKAKKSGREEVKIQKEDKIYLFRAGRVFENMIIIIFDITLAELLKNRQNDAVRKLSYELKTSVQSIITGAQLIENGLVKEENLADVAKKIHQKSESIIESIDKITTTDNNV